MSPNNDRLEAARLLLADLMHAGLDISCYPGLLVRPGGVEQLGDDSLILLPAERMTTELLECVREYRVELIRATAELSVWQDLRQVPPASANGP